MALFTIIVIWRLVLFFVAWFSQTLYLFIPKFPYSDIYLIPSGLPQWIWAWANFDGVHYLTISSHGYFAQFTQAFFPLYPLIIGFTGGLIPFGQLFSRLIIVGLVVSFISFILAIHIFQSLLRLDYDQNKVRWMILFLLVFPTSFYFGALYTEALFLLLTVSAFWFARRNQWWLCSMCGALATATRITGIVLLPVLVWERFASLRGDYLKKVNKKHPVTRIKSLWFFSRHILLSPILYVVPLGLVIYMVYLKVAYGDPLYFWHAQSVWGAERSGNILISPPQVIWRYVKILTSIPPVTSDQQTLIWKFLPEFWVALLELSAFLFGIIILLLGHRQKIRSGYLIYGWLALLLPVLTGTFSSVPRYLLIIFPLYISLGLIKNNLLKIILLGSFGILLWFLSSNFIRGLWVA